MLHAEDAEVVTRTHGDRSKAHAPHHHAGWLLIVLSDSSNHKELFYVKRLLSTPRIPGRLGFAREAQGHFWLRTSDFQWFPPPWPGWSQTNWQELVWPRKRGGQTGH